MDNQPWGARRDGVRKTRDGPPIEIRSPAGTVEVVLPEAPTTGYLWQLIDPPSDVREVARQYEPATEGPVAGGSGSRVFRLEVTTPGRRVLEFRLRRPWEETALERRTVTIVIERGETEGPPAP
jgi:predicted secreted protein